MLFKSEEARGHITPLNDGDVPEKPKLLLNHSRASEPAMVAGPLKDRKPVTLGIFFFTRKWPFRGFAKGDL